MELRRNKGIFCGILITILVLGFVVTKGSVKAAGTVALEYTFNNNKPGNAGGTVKLTSTSSSGGSYDLYWADASGKLSDFDKIASLGVGDTYKFLSLNAIPSGATKLIAMKDGSIEGTFNIPSNKLLGNMNFSFGALSDVHLDGDGKDDTDSNSDFQKELDYFKSKNVSLIANSGDITLDGRSVDRDAVLEKISSLNIPFYTARGNHDCMDTLSSLSEWAKIEPNGLIFEKTINNETFVFLGLNKADYTNPFTSEQISELKSILEKNKNKRVFLFEHVFVGSVGNINGLYPYSSLSDSGTAGEFKNLMKEYKNVILFTGHSHLHFELQRIGEFANVNEKTDEYGHRVHIPSGSKPRRNDADTEDKSSNTYTYEEGALGYLVEVYTDCIVLTGRDFSNNINLPYATYVLYTEGGSAASSDNTTNDATVIMNDDTNPSNGNVNSDASSDTSSDAGIDTSVESDNEESGNTLDSTSDVQVVTNDKTTSNPYNASGTVDVMLVVDKSLSYKDRFDKAKQAVKDLVSDSMEAGNKKVRVGVVEFGLEATKKIGLSQDINQLNQVIDSINLQKGVSGSNMQGGVCEAIEELQTSDAGTKVIIIISDGRPNRIISDLETHNRDRARAAVETDLAKARNTINNLKIVTVDCSTSDDTAAQKFLQGLASSADDGRNLYFKDGNIGESISNLF